MTQQIILEHSFAEGLAGWVAEAPPGAIVEVSDGSLLIDPRQAEHRPPGTEGVNLWHHRPIDGDWAIEWDIEPLAPRVEDNDRCNLLFMFSCAYDDGRDLIEHSRERTGHYTWIHAEPRGVERYREETGVSIPPMRGYTITYYRINSGSDEPYMMVVRKNPGFELLHKEHQTPDDQWAFRHTVRIEKRGGEMRLHQGDTLVLHVVDDGEDRPVWDGGHFGIRSWRTAVRVHGVRVLRLEQGNAVKDEE